MKDRIKVKPDSSFEQVYKKISPDNFEEYKADSKDASAEDKKISRGPFKNAIIIFSIIILSGILVFGIILPAGAIITDRFVANELKHITSVEGDDNKAIDIGSAQDLTEHVSDTGNIINNIKNGWEDFQKKINGGSWDFVG